MDLSKLSAHVNNIALHHSVFALPFAYTGAFLAGKAMPSWHDLLWITVTMVAARSAALGLDNLIDLKYDKVHPRFTKRPMVTGEVKPWEVKLLIGISFLIFIFAVLQLQPICIYLLPIAAIPFVIYPYMKRVTSFCHYVLGIAIAMAPAGGWIAVSGEITLPMVLLAGAVGLWIGAFDVVYGSQDEEFDKAHGLHSMATLCGASGALKVARFSHVICILLFIAVGMLLELSWPYFAGVAVASCVLVYQHSIVSAQDFSRLTQVYFMRNGIVSIAMFIFTVISLQF